MLENLKRVVDGQTYIMGHWAVDKSVEMFSWMLTTFGNGVANVFREGVNLKQLMETEADVSFLKEVIEGLVSKLTPQEYVTRCRMITEGLLIGGQPVVYDQHFLGKIGHLHRVMLEVLKFQYSDFLPASPGKTG